MQDFSKELIGIVFCEDCIFYEPETYDLKSRCKSPLNTKHKLRWWGVEKTLIQKPWKINKQNSCNWHENKKDYKSCMTYLPKY